ncbi:50S ribosomal protein L35ae [Candidatus Woesearchaeota archaeon]|nr:50S ribosomal protein L35ae [Candidatus Woesearchaeota archaeon]
MEATVMNYRRGRHHQNPYQMVLKVGETSEEAKKAIGKTVTWTSPAGKVLSGKIAALHGRKGGVRAHFLEKGLPGQALGQKVKLS